MPPYLLSMGSRVCVTAVPSEIRSVARPADGYAVIQPTIHAIRTTPAYGPAASSRRRQVPLNRAVPRVGSTRGTVFRSLRASRDLGLQPGKFAA